MSDTWGWAGSVKELLSTPYEVWLSSLSSHHVRLWNMNPSQSQIDAWKIEHKVVVDALRKCVSVDPQDILNIGFGSFPKESLILVPFPPAKITKSVFL